MRMVFNFLMCCLVLVLCCCLCMCVCVFFKTRLGNCLVSVLRTIQKLTLVRMVNRWLRLKFLHRKDIHRQNKIFFFKFSKAFFDACVNLCFMHTHTHLHVPQEAVDVLNFFTSIFFFFFFFIARKIDRRRFKSSNSLDMWMCIRKVPPFPPSRKV